MDRSIDRFFFRLCPPQDQLAWNRTQDQLGARMDLRYWKMSAWTSVSQPVHDTSSGRGTKLSHFSAFKPRGFRSLATWDAARQRKPIFTLKGRLICQPLSSLSALIPFSSAASPHVSADLLPRAGKRDDYTNLSPRKSRHFISSQTKSQWWVMSL